MDNRLSGPSAHLDTYSIGMDRWISLQGLAVDLQAECRVRNHGDALGRQMCGSFGGVAP